MQFQECQDRFLRGVSGLKCIELLRTHEVGYDEEILQLSDSPEEIIEILSSLLFAHLVSTKGENRKLLELDSCYADNSDLISILLESVNHKVSQQLIQQLQDLSFRSLSIWSESSPFFEKRISFGTSLVVSEEEDLDSAVDSKHLIGIRLGNATINRNLIASVPFGYHRWQIAHRCTNRSEAKFTISCGSIFATSATYDFVLSLDRLTDYVYWGWSPSREGEREGEGEGGLEVALLQLLVCVNDELEETVRSWRPMMAMMGAMSSEGNTQSETDRMIDTIRRDIEHILVAQSPYAIGRLHQSLSQLLDSCGNLLQLPEAFNRAAQQFIQAKLKGTSRSKLNELVADVVNYSYKYLPFSGINSSERYRLAEFHRILNVVEGQLFDPTSISDLQLLNAIRKLQPNPMESLTSSALTTTNSLQVLHLPILPSESLSSGIDQFLLDSFADVYSQCLVHDVINIGSLLGTSLAGQPAQFGANLLMKLMRSGIAYVGSGGKIMGLMNIERSMLYLGSSQSPWAQYLQEEPNIIAAVNGSSSATVYPYAMSAGLRKRLKDMPRIFRNKVGRGKRLQLKLNSHFDEALRKLRLHHGTDCWVDEHLEAVWKHMASLSPPQLLIFELWYDNELIAADFGHPVASGRAIYIATRFFDRYGDIKHLMPGFLLALIECNVLRKIGCLLWDLGGVDMCPLMQYKYELAGEAIERPVALAAFRMIRDDPPLEPDAIGLDVVTAIVDSTDMEVNRVFIRSMNELNSGMILVDDITVESLSQ